MICICVRQQNYKPLDFRLEDYKFMTKGILVFSCLFLGLLISCSDFQLDSELDASRLVQINPTMKGDIPPSVRKCLTVKCSAGYYCFYGRCVLNDTLCSFMKCPDGQRCSNGQCLSQLNTPKKNICTSLTFNLTKQQCSSDLLKICQQQSLSYKVCGFNKDSRRFYDYSSPCYACNDNISQIDFYYSTGCDAAPRVCSQDEQCLNGVCSTIFNDPAFQNARTCNANIDCHNYEVCAGHKCIHRADLINYMEAKSETAIMFVRI